MQSTVPRHIEKTLSTNLTMLPHCLSGCTGNVDREEAIVRTASHAIVDSARISVLADAGSSSDLY
jgi:hypothetical protein